MVYFYQLSLNTDDVILKLYTSLCLEHCKCCQNIVTGIMLVESHAHAQLQRMSGGMSYHLHNIVAIPDGDL